MTTCIIIIRTFNQYTSSAAPDDAGRLLVLPALERTDTSR